MYTRTRFIDETGRFVDAEGRYVDEDGRYIELLLSLRESDLNCMIGALRFPPLSDDIVQEYCFRIV